MKALDNILKWEPLNIEGCSPEQNALIAERMENIFKSWENTPHMDGQQCKGKACDCVHFVSGVLDELAGTFTVPERLPRDIAFHQPETAWKGFRRFKEQFPAEEVEGAVQPGDILIVGPRNGGPGHAILVGTKSDLWHSDTYKISRTGLGLVSSASLAFKKAMRITDRKAWVR